MSFDISWVDPDLHKYYLADRNNLSVDVIDTSTNPPSFLTKFTPGFVGARGKLANGTVCGPPTDATTCISNNDVSGPDGVLTLPASGNKTQLWVGDGNSRVWVLDASSGNPVTVPPGATNPISTVSQDPMIPSNPSNRADELCFDSLTIS